MNSTDADDLATHLERPVMTLDSRYYTDREIFTAETRAVFFRTWQYLGHVSQVRNAGDYLAVRLLGQSLVLLRDHSNGLRAFFNVCRHRAHELLQGQGNTRAICCPYHAWTYALDGRLQRAPHAEATPGFEADAIRLQEVRLEVMCGFVFVNLDAAAPGMAEFYPGVESELREYVPNIDDLQPALNIAVAEDCNWKVSVENYSECYHCRRVHPTFANGVIDPASYNIMPQGRCLRHTTDSAPGAKMSYEYDSSVPHAGDYSSWFLWPSFSFQVYPGNVLNTYRFRPLAVDSTMVERGWYSMDGTASANLVALAEQDRDTTVAEDVKLVNSVQRGLQSLGYASGPLVLNPGYGVNSEHSVQALQQWVLEALDSDLTGHGD